MGGKDLSTHAVTIFTDGSCSPNPGPGGWAALFLWEEKSILIRGFRKDTTNNRMELRAVLEALEFLEVAHTVDLRTDNQYVRGVLQEGWNAKKNLDLIGSTKESMEMHNVEIRWVKAHVGNRYNELADDAARLARKHKEEFLVDRSPLSDTEADKTPNPTSYPEQVKVGKTATIRFLGENLGTVTPLPRRRSRLELNPSSKKYPLLEALTEDHGTMIISFDRPAHVVLSKVVALAGSGLEKNDWDHSD